MASDETNNSSRQSNVRGSNRDLIGLSYPFRKEGGEFPKMDRNIDAVSNNLLLQFRQPMRSRVMRPLIGTLADKMVFENIGELLRARLVREIGRTINVNDPRIEIIDISIEEKDTVVDSLVLYSVNGVRQEANVSIPKTGL